MKVENIKKAVGQQRQGQNDAFKSVTKLQNNLDFATIDSEIFNWCLNEHEKKNIFAVGQRNAFLTALSHFCNEYGVNEQTCLNECKSRFESSDFTAFEIESTIQSIYKNHSSNFRTKQFIPKEQYKKQNETPVFPINVFPDKIQNIIFELHDKLQFNHDLISAGILSAVSTAIGNSFELVHNNHVNKAIIWCISVAEKGKGKSEPQSWCKKPFHDYDYKSRKEHAEKKELWDEYESLNKNEKNSADKPEKPTDRHFQFILGDYTPETLYRVHGVNQRGILIYADEIMKMITSFNRYSNNGEQQFFNELWNGKTANYDRVNTSVFIQNCFVNILGTIQTLFLKGLSANNRTIDGFLERLLFFYPDNFLKPKPNGKELSEFVYLEYKHIIEKLLNCQFDLWEDGQIKPTRLKLEHDAGILFNQWLNEIIDKQNNATNENERAILAKLEIYCYRFSLFLQLLFWACGEGTNQHVELKSVKGAITMVNYFHKTALKVYSTIESPEKIEINDKLIATYLKNVKSKSYAEIQQILGLKNRSNVQHLINS